MKQIKYITQKEFEELHEQGDIVVIERLIELNQHGDTFELDNLYGDCTEHAGVKEGGEPYHIFKDRYMEVVEKYIKKETETMNKLQLSKINAFMKEINETIYIRTHELNDLLSGLTPMEVATRLSRTFDPNHEYVRFDDFSQKWYSYTEKDVINEYNEKLEKVLEERRVEKRLETIHETVLFIEKVKGEKTLNAHMHDLVLEVLELIEDNLE